MAVNSNGRIYTYHSYEWDCGFTPVSSANGTATSQDIPPGSIFGIIKNSVLVSYDGNNWLPYLVPSDGCLIISKADNSIYVKDSIAKKFIAVSSSETSSKNSLINEKFTLASENIASKSLELSESIKASRENEFFCFVSGIVQFARTNFTASGNITF